MRHIPRIGSLLISFVAALALFVSSGSHAFAATLTVNGSQTFQTIDGYGVNINTAWQYPYGTGAWVNDHPAIDMLVDQLGAKIFRAVIEEMDWEAVNDNSDPNTFNWTYYNGVYSNPKFQAVWDTLHYLNQKGITNNLVISFMGKAPDWMGPNATIATANEDEFVETMASLLYYARNTAGIQFTLVSPLNETDLPGTEGPNIGATQYASIMHKLSVKLDAIGMSDVRFIGPDASGSSTFPSYMSAVAADPTVMAKMVHWDAHCYAGYGCADTSSIQSTINNSSTALKSYWVSETATYQYLLNQIVYNPSANLIWDGFDSLYNHAVRDGRGTTPPNDSPGIEAPLIAYNTTTGVFTPRKGFYENAQLFAFVNPGAQRIGATDNDANLVAYSFRNSNGQLVIVGRNNGASNITVSGTLTNVPTVSTFQLYQTNSSLNLQRGSDVPVTSGSFSLTVTPGTSFTLAASTSTSPAVSLTANPASVTSGNSSTLTWSSANVTSCTGTNFSTGNAVSGSVLVTPSATTNYSISCTGIGGTATANITVTVTVLDTIAPSIPTNLSGTAVSSNQANLTWTASTDNVAVTGYKIFRGGTQIGTSATNSFSDNSLTPSTSYTYTVSAYDAASNESAQSSPVSVTTPAPSPSPTLIGEYETAWSGATSPKTTTTFTAQAGDVLVASAMTEDTPVTASISGGSLTWTRRQVVNVTGYGWLSIWTATVDTTKTMSVTFTRGGNAGNYGGNVFQFRNASGIGASAKANVASGAPTLNLTTTQTNSAVVVASVDWAALSGTSRVWRTNAGPFTEKSYANVSGAYTIYSGYHPNAGALGTYAVGLSAPSGQKYSIVAIEVKGNGVADTVAPTVPTGLAGTAVSSSQVNLTWTASTDNVAVVGYKIFRNGTQVGTSTTNSFSNTGLTASTTYAYTVSAYDAAGNNSAQSTGVSVTTPANVPAPTVALTATPASITSGQSSTLSWSSTNATSCTGTGFTAPGTSGSLAVSPMVTTTYSITCTGTGGTSPAASATVAVTAGGTTETIWGTLTAPSYSDNVAYELGTVFTPTVNGQVKGIRLYLATGETGSHTARIWNNNGTLVGGPYTFTTSGSGWFTYTLPTPVSLTAGTADTVSVTTGTDAAHAYVSNNNTLTSGGNNGAHLTYPVNAGVFSDTLGTRPTSVWQASNYLRDIVFLPN